MSVRDKRKDTRETRHRAVKVRLYPNAAQRHRLKCLFGAVRWIYNWGLKRRRSAWKERGESLSYEDLANRLPELKKQEETAWLKDVASQPLQQALRNLDRAFSNFFNKKLKAHYPTFKCKRGKQSAAFPQFVKVEDDKIYLPTIGWVKAKIHREISGTVKTVTVSLSATGKYYASILLNDGVVIPDPPKTIFRARGIDLGLTHIGITDDGDKNVNPRFIKNGLRNLRRRHRELSRKKKGSKNRAKARIRLAKAYEKVSNVRLDFQHKRSLQLIGDNQAIIVETLQILNMLKNKKLARHISDAAWGQLLRILNYKCEWLGVHFIALDRWFASSKTCSECNYKMTEMPLSVRYWTCPECHSAHDRDINAAKNIRQKGIDVLIAEGQSVIACGDLHKTGEMPAVVAVSPRASEAGSPVL